MNDSHSTRFVVIINAEGAKSTAGHCIALPVQRDMINKPLKFFTEDPDNVNILFENFRNSASSDKGVQPSPLLKSLQRVLAPNRESPIRDCTVPILENGTMTYIGSATSSILIATPFQSPYPPPRPSPGSWKDEIAGHRGSAAHSTARKKLSKSEEILSNHFSPQPAWVCPVSEFDVQLTKDYGPVIFHDFLVMETGGDIPLHFRSIYASESARDPELLIGYHIRKQI